MKKILYSYKTTISLLSIYIILLSLATILEKYYGTSFIKTTIYYSPLLILIQFFFVINFISIIIQHKLLNKRKIGFLIMHFSFIIILTGALVSHIWSEEGIMHIRESERSDKILIQKNEDVLYKQLPFNVELIDFNLKRYPGSSRPSSYESLLTIYYGKQKYQHSISMNNILDIQGYRIFQTSYDKDEKGTILTINKDVAGRNITYTGYFILLLGFIFSFVNKNSRLSYLNTKIKNIKTYFIPLILLSTCSYPSLLSANTILNLDNDTIQYKNISLEHAAKFGALPMLANNGRIEPLNTFASKILRKLHKSEMVGGLNADQFLVSALTFPETWISIPFIHLSNSDVSLYYDLSQDYCVYLELFDEQGNYKLTQKLEEIQRKAPSERNLYEKDLLKLDEQINIFYQLVNFNMINIFPHQNDMEKRWYAPGDDLSIFNNQDSLFITGIFPWYIREVRKATQNNDWSKADEIVDMIKAYQVKRSSTLELNDNKIKAELWYNKLHIFKHCQKVYLIIGGILLVSVLISLFRKRNYTKVLNLLAIGIIVIFFLLHLFGITLRGYISGYAPWSNSYETMVFVAWMTVLAGLLFFKKSKLILALSTLFSGLILFVSGLNWMDPQIDTLVPVLKSPWLMFHVATIIAAYGFWGISWLIGVTNMILMSSYRSRNAIFIVPQIYKMTYISEMSMLIGLALMTIGTFLGAIWANESWGRYWGWDPKETWALITIILYTITTHIRLVKSWNNIWIFNLMSVVSFYSVLMTYFGVNYFLSGMHSYGQKDSPTNLFIYIISSILILSFIAMLSYKNKHIWGTNQEDNRS